MIREHPSRASGLELQALQQTYSAAQVSLCARVWAILDLPDAPELQKLGFRASGFGLRVPKRGTLFAGVPFRRGVYQGGTLFWEMSIRHRANATWVRTPRMQKHESRVGFRV